MRAYRRSSSLPQTALTSVLLSYSHRETLCTVKPFALKPFALKPFALKPFALKPFALEPTAVPHSLSCFSGLDCDIMTQHHDVRRCERHYESSRHNQRN